MAKTIHTILYDDVLDGSKIVTMDNCVCQLYDIKRNDENIIKNGDINLSKPALYVLLNRSKRKAYIGETDDFSQRIASHMLKKDFWDEALAFMANDNSLTTTEVRYLESLSYEVANNCGTYDLSENTQVPKKPYATDSLKFKIIDFFGYVKLLAQFVGCDLFETKKIKTVKKTQNVSENKSIQPTNTSSYIYNLDIKQEDLKGKVDIILNEKATYKARFGVAIVREYLKEHPKTTLYKIKKIFNNDLLGEWIEENMIEDDIPYARSLKKTKGAYKHQVETSQILTSGDGFKFVVSNQWGYENSMNLIRFAHEQGWVIKVKK